MIDALTQIARTASVSLDRGADQAIRPPIARVPQRSRRPLILSVGLFGAVTATVLAIVILPPERGEDQGVTPAAPVVAGPVPSSSVDDVPDGFELLEVSKQALADENAALDSVAPSNGRGRAEQSPLLPGPSAAIVWRGVVALADGREIGVVRDASGSICLEYLPDSPEACAVPPFADRILYTGAGDGSQMVFGVVSLGESVRVTIGPENTPVALGPSEGWPFPRWPGGADLANIPVALGPSADGQQAFIARVDPNFDWSRSIQVDIVDASGTIVRSYADVRTP